MPPAPRIGASLRAAVEAFYFNSWRFVPANVIFGIALIVVAAAIAWAPIGYLAGVILVPPAAGLMRMATHYQRERYVFFSEFWEPMRRRPLAILGLGSAQIALTFVLVVDVVIGPGIGGLLGPLLSVSAVYGFGLAWVVAVATWPLVLDPARQDEPLRRQLRLGALLVLAHPFRIGLVAFVVGVLLAASTFAVIVVMTIGVAIAWLVVAHEILPAADRFEGRTTLVVED